MESLLKEIRKMNRWLLKTWVADSWVSMKQAHCAVCGHAQHSGLKLRAGSGSTPLFSYSGILWGFRTSCQVSLTLSYLEGLSSIAKHRKTQGRTLFCIREVKSVVEVLEQSEGRGEISMDQPSCEGNSSHTQISLHLVCSHSCSGLRLSSPPLQGGLISPQSSSPSRDAVRILRRERDTPNNS